MPSRGFAVLLFLGLFAAVACGSDDDSSGSLGTAGAGRSGAAGASAGTGGASAGSAGQAVAGARDDLSAGAGGVGGVAGGMSEGPPVSYPCAGPNTVDGSAGQGGEAGQGGSALSCVTGQTFCFVRAGIPYPGKPTVYTPQCSDFSNSLAKCATNPSCDCLCSSWFHCETECRCAENNGFATVTCDQI